MSIVIMIDECPRLFCTTIDGRQMVKPAVKKRKKPAPPATGKGELIGVRIQPVPLSALDAFVADQREPVSRPQAIRLILMKFLRSKGYLKTSRQ